MEEGPTEDYLLVRELIRQWQEYKWRDKELIIGVCGLEGWCLGPVWSQCKRRRWENFKCILKTESGWLD